MNTRKRKVRDNLTAEEKERLEKARLSGLQERRRSPQEQVRGETQMLNFIAKFAVIGFAVAIVGAVLGLDGASAADLAFCRRSGCGLQRESLGD